MQAKEGKILMSDTRRQPGKNRVRRLLTATRMVPRRLCIASLTGLITPGGVVALAATPAASAATATTAASAATATYP
jgi:hypothetical protein